MKKEFIFATLLFSASAIADPTILGMELGRMTEQALKTKYNVSHSGVNKYSGGNMYSIPVSSIDFEGLREGLHNLSLL